MRRRPILRSLVATGALGTLAGCNGLFHRSSSPTVSSSASPPTDTRTGTVPKSVSARTPYRASDAPLLDRPRGLQVRNLTSTARFLTVVVFDGDETVFVASRAVAAGDTVSFSNLVATASRHRVLVETADGLRASYEWAVRPDLDDLWVDLTPDISFRRPVVSTLDSPFALTDDQTIGYEIPTAVGVREALGRVPALALDNDTPDTVRTRLHVWNGGQRYFASSFDVPPDVRALVPVLPASQRYDIVLRSAGREAIYDWQPSVLNTLYAQLGPSLEFRCGDANHDLRVRNDTRSATRVTIEVRTGAESLFSRTLDVDAGSVETIPSALDPAGPFTFAIETDTGLAETYNWVRCAPNGPVTVSVSDADISVAVRPIAASG